MGLFGTTKTTQFEKYLGLPPVISRAKKRAFNSIKDRVMRRLQGWEEKLLSQAGREVLIKAVVQAMLTYAMSCFKISAGLCSELSSMAIRYWWGQRKEGRKIHWLGKQHLYQAKEDRGIGFGDLQLFNLALLARQGWRLLQNPDSLIHRFLKANYFPAHSFLDATVKPNASYIWRSLCETRGVLGRDMRWRVDDGTQIKIWKDSWIPTNNHPRLLSPIQLLQENATVDALIDLNRMCWRYNLVDQCFMPSEASAIKQIPLSSRKPPDICVWAGTKRG